MELYSSQAEGGEEEGSLCVSRLPGDAKRRREGGDKRGREENAQTFVLSATPEVLLIFFQLAL